MLERILYTSLLFVWIGFHWPDKNIINVTLCFSRDGQGWMQLLKEVSQNLTRLASANADNEEKFVFKNIDYRQVDDLDIYLEKSLL